MDRDHGSREFLKGVWAPKVILDFGEKVPLWREVLPKAQSSGTLNNT